MPKRTARVGGDVVALAKAINRRRLEFKQRFDGEVFKRDDTVSRILENDPDYVPHRPRRPDKKREPVRNPGIFTIQDIATKLRTTVGALLGEHGFDVTLDDRRAMRDFVLYLTRRFQLNDTRLSFGKEVDEYQFEIPEERFRQRDYDYPRPLHAWVVPDAPAAAAGGAEADFQLMATHMLHSIREVREGRLQVIRVIGDSMADRIEEGYKLLVDTRRSRPANGDMVAVYVKSEGGLLGYWRYERNRYYLDKHNTAAYGPVALGHPDEWILWGTATTIVEAPIERRRPVQ